MNAKGPILLLITAILWGMAFVAQTDASQHVQPFTFNASRNFVGALFLTGVIAWRKRTGADKQPIERGGAGYTKKALLVGGIACGVVLFVASYLQQSGITSYPSDAAVSGRSGFITALYMVMVAVIGLFVGKKPHILVFVAVGVALVGMWFLCVPDGIDNIYFGDVLVFLCAIGYAAHIIVIDRYTHVDGVRLSRVQLLTSGALSLACALAFEQPEWGLILAALIPILYAGICSDGIAYTFQIIAQQTTDPTVASILMSLESVFAALGGWLILSEALTPVELLGCALVFAAVMLAQVPDFIENARQKRASNSISATR
ncbi:MAG: DMT family transporter [Coriobacteriia bacterium]|nr:DMT family transporter [Coriobacteriia bacterium]